LYHGENAKIDKIWAKVLIFYKKFEFCIMKLLRFGKKEYIFSIV